MHSSGYDRDDYSLGNMVEAGMEPEMEKIFYAQSESLLAAIRSENNRFKLINRLKGH